MISTNGSMVSSVVAVYPNHAQAERAVRQLHDAGFALGDLSIVARCEKLTGHPFGLVGLGDYAEAGAETGALFGWLLGLSIGVGFLMMPGLGLLVVAGPIAASLLAGIEGGVEGTVLGTLAGSLIGWGITKERARKYEKHVGEGKLLVVMRSKPDVVARARNLLSPNGAEQIDVYESPAS